MARDFNGSSEYLTNGNAIVTTTPLTFACWFNQDTADSNDALISISDTGTGNHFWSLKTFSNRHTVAQVKQTGSAVSIEITGGTYNTGADHHACAVFTTGASGTDMAIYLDAGFKNTTTTNKTPGSGNVDTASIGAHVRSTIGNYFDGEIWEAGIWNIALTDDEVSALASGLSPLAVRPEGLVAYWPLHGNASPETDWIGNYPMTLTGSPAQTSSRGIIYPVQPYLVVPSFAAAGPADVQPTVGSLVLTGASPSVALLIAVAPSAASLTLTGASPSVGQVTGFDIGGTSLTLTGESPAIDRLYGLSPAAGTLTITGAQPSIALKRDVTLTAASLALTGESPSVSKGIDRAITAGTITLTGETPSVALKRDITLTAGDLAITGATPGVALKRDISLAAATLTLTGESPAVAVTSGLDIQPTAAALALTGAQIGVALLIDLALTAESLSITGESPTVTVETGVDVQPTAASLSLTGASPTIALRYNVAPVAGTLSITGAAISVTIPGVTPVAPSVPDGGGRGLRRRRRSVWRPRKVIIGGEVYVVRTPLELRELLEAHRRKLQAQLKATHTPKAQRSLKRQITVVRKKLETARADARTWVDDLQDDDEEILEIWMLLH